MIFRSNMWLHLYTKYTDDSEAIQIWIQENRVCHREKLYTRCKRNFTLTIWLVLTASAFIYF